VPFSGVPVPEVGLPMVSKLELPGAEMEALRVLYGGRVLDGDSSMAINPLYFEPNLAKKQKLKCKKLLSLRLLLTEKK
jgi:hypothetical protein